MAEINGVTTGPPVLVELDLLDPTLDVVFRLMMTREPRLLRHMLEGILCRPIASLRIIDANGPSRHVRGKGVVFDVRCVLDDGVRVVLEMQRRCPPALWPRLVFYWARDFSDQLSRGEDYDQLRPTVVAAWLLEPLFPSLTHLHAVFETYERHTLTSPADLSDQPGPSIHLLQLGTAQRQALLASRASGYDAVVERWARFLTRYDDPAELERLALEDPMMAVARQALEELSRDPEARRQAQRREDELRLYELELRASRKEGWNDGMAKGWNDGMAKGWNDGMAKGWNDGVAKGWTDGVAKGWNDGMAKGWNDGMVALLLHQLTTRFGPLSPSVVTRVEAATPEQLDVWAKRVITEGTLDDVLAP